MTCDKNHKKDEWCGISLTEDEMNTFKNILTKLSLCHIPHSSAWCSALECPACLASDFKEALLWIGIEQKEK